jgi:phosphatidylglycerophosphate synthase
VLVNQGYPMSAAATLFISTLLDWLDGPVARKYGHCSLFGSGIDWYADVMAQIVTALWWSMLEPRAMPWLTVALTIEIGTCIFDYAATTSGRYPRLAATQSAWPLKILQWATPEQTYTWFGTYLWLAYPICMLARCLQLEFALAGADTAATVARLVFFSQALPALLYLWHEGAQGWMIVETWREHRRKEHFYALYRSSMLAARQNIAEWPLGKSGADAAAAPGNEFATRSNLISDDDGYAVAKWRLSTRESDLLLTCIEHAADDGSWVSRLASGQVFWVNLWQRAAPERGMPARAKLPRYNELEQFAHRVAKLADATGVVDGIGFIINPPGTRAQKWHVDYSRDYATVFIICTGSSVESSTQYIQPLGDAQRTVPAAAAESPDLVPLEEATLDGCTPTVAAGASVRATFAPAFTPLFMKYGTVHRGNGNPVDGTMRIAFFVSFTRASSKFEPIAEPDFADFK